jgi:hypothetical protein
MGFLTNIWPFFLILRPKNLALIVFTMTVLQYGVIHQITTGSPVLDLQGFISFCTHYPAHRRKWQSSQ